MYLRKNGGGGVDPKPKLALLIGDSHAAMMSSALIEAGQAAGWNTAIWGLPCNVLLQSNDSEKSNKVSNAICSDVQHDLQRWIMEKKPNLIIISFFVRSEWDIAQLSRNWSSLAGLSSNIVWIENSPIFPDTHFMQRVPLAMRTYLPKKVFDIDEMDLSHESMNQQVANLIKQKNGMVVSIDEIFCSRVSCMRWSQGKWLYRDVDHLSVYGGKLLVPRFTKLVKSEWN